MIDCQHMKVSGICSLNLYGGRPSPGTCMRACEQRLPTGRTFCAKCWGEHATEACPLPDGSDVAQERQRLQQGGCCGEPSRGSDEVGSNPA